MSDKELLVIDPAGRVPELDSFNNFSRMGVKRLSYHLPALFGMDSLRKISDEVIGGMLVMGSGASIYDDLEWQEELNAWLLPRIKAGIPTFGFCYGHQLLAHFFDAKVDFAHRDQSKFLGFREVSWKGDDRLKIDSTSLNLVVSHREVVTSCPPGCHLIATSGNVEVDGFAHDDLPVFALQPHPEATWGFLKNQSIDVEYNERSFDDGHSVVKAFFDFCGLRS